MPRSSAATTDVAEYVIPAPPLPAPACLPAEQRAEWEKLVGAVPGRFTAADSPLLLELIRHAAIARTIGAALDAMSTKSLAADSKAGSKTRSVYLQLAAAAREESKVVAMLSVKLRLARTTAQRKSLAEAAERASPSGPRPWDVPERH
jgi:hypothetical protein